MDYDQFKEDFGVIIDLPPTFNSYIFKVLMSLIKHKMIPSTKALQFNYFTSIVKYMSNIYTKWVSFL